MNVLPTNQVSHVGNRDDHGPVSYLINTGDLATVVQGNRIREYADETYIIIPASNVQHREAELEHVTQWAQANDLKLNRTKSVEVIFSSRRKPQECHPPKLLDICHVTTITILSILGITLIIISTGRLKMREWKMWHEHNCMGGKCRSGKCSKPHG